MKVQFKTFTKITALAIFLSMLINIGSPITFAVDSKELIEATEYTIEEVPNNIMALFQDDDAIEIAQIDDDIFTLTADIEGGNIVQKTFAVPIKYETEDGKFELIDTGMVKKSFFSALLSGYDYENAANEFTAEFSKNQEKGLRLTSDDTSVKLSIPVKEGQMKAAAKIEPFDEETGTDDAFVYENAFGVGTSVKYYNTSLGVKEDIVLEQNPGTNRFSYLLNTQGLNAALLDDV